MEEHETTDEVWARAGFQIEREPDPRRWVLRGFYAVSSLAVILLYKVVLRGDPFGAVVLWVVLTPLAWFVGALVHLAADLLEPLILGRQYDDEMGRGIFRTWVAWLAAALATLLLLASRSH